MVNRDDDRGGNTTNDVTRRLLEGIGTLEARQVSSLVESGADVNATHNGESVLCLAAQGNPHSEVLEVLIDAGADVAPNVHSFGWTLLQHAAWNIHNPQAVDVVIATGVSCEETDSDGQTALYTARTAGAVRSLFAAGVGLGKPDPRTTPLHSAVLNSIIAAKQGSSADQSPVLHALIEGGIPPRAVDDEGWTALTYAAFHGYGHENVFQALISLTGSRGLEMKAEDGSTPLMNAATSYLEGDHGPEAIRMLVAAGAQVDASDDAGLTALDYVQGHIQRLEDGDGFPTDNDVLHLRRARANAESLKAESSTSRKRYASKDGSTDKLNGGGVAASAISIALDVLLGRRRGRRRR